MVFVPMGHLGARIPGWPNALRAMEAGEDVIKYGEPSAGYSPDPRGEHVHVLTWSATVLERKEHDGFQGYRRPNGQLSPQSCVGHSQRGLLRSGRSVLHEGRGVPAHVFGCAQLEKTGNRPNGL
jgi:hypothetical protein